MPTVVSSRGRPVRGVKKLKSGGRIQVASPHEPGSVARQWGKYTPVKKARHIYQSVYRYSGDSKNSAVRDTLTTLIKRFPEKFSSYQSALHFIRAMQEQDAFYTPRKAKK